ncbi:hypothetical protein K488DRAFT_91586 [Vararia minispora EC-137]|uniref:Uncharacterized protein n=1 Tax=Vararia minispora EC-137 TaxID=1314806 RepID=A0ACB8Q5I8_9AGAM|nr:hypothetical protein K488DRAFT_91586 [Vararia minispora EC-137]
MPPTGRPRASLQLDRPASNDEEDETFDFPDLDAEAPRRVQGPDAAFIFEDDDEAPQGFDPDSIGTGLAFNDPLTQEELYDALTRRNDKAPSQLSKDAFNAQRGKNLTLSSLGRAYSSSRALPEMLAYAGQKVSLTVDNHLLIPADSRNLVFDMKNNYLDFILAVPTHPGCEILHGPSSNRAEGDFSLRLDFTQRNVLFRLKHGYLGFSPNGRMLRVSELSNMFVWLALIPSGFFDETLDDPFFDADPDPDTPTSQMSEKTYLSVLAFFATVLAELHIGHVEIRGHGGYPDISSRRSFNTWTNLLKADGVQPLKPELSKQSVRRLHRSIMQSWDTWVAGVPTTYDKEFLASHKIGFVLMRYGQDIAIHTDSSELRNLQADQFVNWIHWPSVKYMSWATATSIRAAEVRAWTPRPVADVLHDAHGPIYILHVLRA